MDIAFGQFKKFEGYKRLARDDGSEAPEVPGEGPVQQLMRLNDRIYARRADKWWSFGGMEWTDKITPFRLRDFL